MASSAYAVRRGARLEMAIQWIVNRHGYNNVGFLTITFPENLIDWDEAERRFSSFEKNVLSLYCRDWALVVQYQARGAIHYHLVCGLGVDIRTGTNLEVICNRKLPRWLRYGKAAVSENLRQLWDGICMRAQGRKKVEGRYQTVSDGYGMGRVELLPLRKEPGAVAGYLRNYLKIEPRPEHAKKKRVRFSRSITAWLRPHWSLVSYGSFMWRKKFELTAYELGLDSLGDVEDLMGGRWFRIMRDAIVACPIEISRADYDRGLGEKWFQRVVWPEFSSGQGRSGEKWYRFLIEVRKAAERLSEECGRGMQDVDPDWAVPVWEPLTEWQLGLLLMNYERQGGEKERSLPASAFGDCSRVG